MQPLSPRRKQDSRLTRFTEPHSAEDHASNAERSNSHRHREPRKPKFFLDPLNVVRSTRSSARIVLKDREKQIPHKPPSFAPTFVSSSSGDSSLLHMDQSKIASRDKKKPKSGAVPNDLSGAPDVAWMAPPSWVSGDQPEPNVSSSEDEKAPLSKQKSRRRATILHTLQNQGVESPNYRIRVYRTNTEYHILTCNLATTAAQLSTVLNTIIHGLEERDDHRLYLKERGRGSSHRLPPFSKPTKYHQQNACFPRPSDRQISYEGA